MDSPQHVVEKTIIICNKTGLHARPAAIFVQVANKFDCEITVTKGKQTVNGKSIMGILMLAAAFGQEVILAAHGPDAAAAVAALEKILLNCEEGPTRG